MLKHEPTFKRPPLITGGGLPSPKIPDPTVPDMRKAKHAEHYHTDEYGLLVKCYHNCPSWLKILLVSAAMNVFWEFVTFWPVHHFFTYMGWIH